MSLLTAVLRAEQENYHCISSFVFILGHKITLYDLYIRIYTLFMAISTTSAAIAYNPFYLLFVFLRIML